MGNLIAGIDPGLSGAICLYDPTLLDRNKGSVGSIQEMFDIPVHEITTNGKKKRRIDLYEVARFLDQHSKSIRQVIMEAPNAMPGQGVTSMFNFGFVCGALQGIVVANFLPLELVTPAVWKKAMGLTKDKDAVRRHASHKAPHEAKHWPLVKHDGRAEAFLLCCYHESREEKTER